MTLKKFHHNLTTARKGHIGQNIVEQYLLKKDAKLYAPVVDDFGIDYVVYHKKKYITIQVKYHTAMVNDTSIAVRVRDTTADWIAVPCHVDNNTYIIWYKNKRRGEFYHVSFALYHPKNNQVDGINFYKSFLKSPID